MSAFPPRATLAGTPDNATAQAWFLSLFDAVTGLLGLGGGAAEARSQLGVDQPTVAISVAANAMTIALKTGSGNNPTAAIPLPIPFRSSTLASGVTNVRNAVAATSVVIPAGATLGSANATDQWVYVYGLDNAGTVELAVSATNYGADFVGSTTAISAGATSASVIYSTTARASMAMRLLSMYRHNQATAGTYALVPVEITYPDYQPQSAMRSCVAAGTVDAITGAFGPAITSLASIAGQPLFVRASGANATTTPTFNPNGLGAKTIVKGSNAALSASDIPGAGHWMVLVYDITLGKFVLQNPAYAILSPGAGFSNFAVYSSSGTFTLPAGVTKIKLTLTGGGGGGGAGGAICGLNAGGTGGGAGGTAIKILSGLTPGNTLTVTVGAGGASATSGGTSSVSSGTQTITTVSASGGALGSGWGGAGGAGGVGSGGDMNINGGGGASNMATLSGGGYSRGAAGGNSFFGAGAPGVDQATGAAGGAYGGGGAGGGVNGAAGGAGGAGVVFVEY